MRHLKSSLFGVAIVLTSLSASLASRAASSGQADDEVTDEQVGEAIEKLKAFLWEKQDKTTGAWDVRHGGAEGRNASGPSAIAAYALLAAGERHETDRMKAALKYLREYLASGVESSKRGTYEMGLHAHVWAQLPDALCDGPIRTTLSWLEKASQAGKRTTANYTGTGDGDHSNTQYMLLGLWECAKRDYHLTYNDFWEKVIEHWTGVQQDGGWGYTSAGSGSKPTVSMTAAGLTALLVAQQEAYRDRKSPAQLSNAITEGLNWMNKVGARLPRNYYGLYGIERVGLASGVRYFDGKDWFAEGAATILKAIRRGRGGVGDVPNSAFALLFLARGRVPVWITKLGIPGIATNNRPNDLYFLTKHLTDYREGELNFYAQSISDPAESLRATPVLWLASHQAVTLSREQQENLRRYLELGGLLVCNPDEDSAAFVESIRNLAAAMYPNLKFKPLPADHPLYTAQHPVSPASARIEHLHSGTRDLIILSAQDWGWAFQTGTLKNRTDPWLKLGANLFVWVTNRGVLPNRLVRNFETRDPGGKAAGQVAVALAGYGPATRGEPRAWEPVATRLFNRTGLELVASPVELEALAASGAKLAHLAGADPKVVLTSAQLDAIQAYLDAGGTLLVEDVGGRSGFAISMEKQLAAKLGVKETRFLRDEAAEPIVTGQGLEGAYDLSVVGYRHWTVWNLTKVGTQSRLGAFYLKNRPAVVFAFDDLSLGSLDVRHWGISGYNTETARRTLVNLVLASNRKP